MPDISLSPITFDLPPQLIAQQPARPRDQARLLVYNRQTGQITDDYFYNLGNYLNPQTTLVVNNSKVEHCRWQFPAARLEVFVLNKLDTHTIQAMVRPGRKFKLGALVVLDDQITAQVIGIDNDGFRTLKLNIRHDSPLLLRYEHVPLPPYIKQDDSLAAEYQTVYAEPLGSKAAPTAGLHFTNRLLADLATKHAVLELTLHVGLGTFAPLTAEQLKAGRLHSEFYQLSQSVSQKLKQAQHVTAVGTTTTRTLETVAKDGFGQSASGWTDILIAPGFEFQRSDSLITNFHLPGTSLLLLVEAFIGDRRQLQRIYQHAIDQEYRFYSFGDAMLII